MPISTRRYYAYMVSLHNKYWVNEDSVCKSNFYNICVIYKKHFSDMYFKNPKLVYIEE